MEQKVVGGLFGSDVEGFGVGPGVSREAGGGFDAAGSADGEEERRFIESGENAIKVERSFAKPADVRADFATAGARRKFARGFVEFDVVERRTGAGVAAAFEEFAVHVHDARGACLLVKVVDVLCAEEETIGQGVF